VGTEFVPPSSAAPAKTPNWSLSSIGAFKYIAATEQNNANQTMNIEVFYSQDIKQSIEQWC
jgi:hypothetical protein